MKNKNPVYMKIAFWTKAKKLINPKYDVGIVTINKYSKQIGEIKTIIRKKEFKKKI